MTYVHLQKVLIFTAFILLFSVVYVTDSRIPAMESASQWVWLDKMLLVASGLITCSLIMGKGKGKLNVSLHTAVSLSLMIWGGVEAVFGLRQLFGYAPSRHALYTLTGTFYNPGPYSCYLAMVLPVCLHGYLAWKGKKENVFYRLGTYFSLTVMLTIVCVLPGGMSRSAWLAASISCTWVYSCHAHGIERLKKEWLLHRRRTVSMGIGILLAATVAAVSMFYLKPDSAKGRLFMWHMTSLAIAEKPFTGYGSGNFGAAYGLAQEKYFTTQPYETWEEDVAESPEYAFNEYLQMATEHGVVALTIALLLVAVCWWKGFRSRHWGICGAILSLLVFAFSSYPSQYLSFTVVLTALLAACVLKGKAWEWVLIVIAAIAIGGGRLTQDLDEQQKMRAWKEAQQWYEANAYEEGKEEYETLYPSLKKKAMFLYEYGHILHKLGEYDKSNKIMQETLQISGNPMMLNIMGKNYQLLGKYEEAEKCYLRSIHRLPGRIYPYYLLAKLYLEDGFYQPEKFEEIRKWILTKKEKVPSKAIDEMREELQKVGLPLIDRQSSLAPSAHDP